MFDDGVADLGGVLGLGVAVHDRLRQRSVGAPDALGTMRGATIPPTP